MAMQPETNSITIGLNIMTEGQSRRDIALAQETGHAVFTHLKEQSQNQNYTIEPAETNMLGAGDVFTVFWQFVHDNQDIVIAAFDGVIAVLKAAHAKLSKSKGLSTVSAAVDFPDRKVAAHGPTSIEEVVAQLEEERHSLVEIKEGKETQRKEFTETKITIKVTKTYNNTP